MLIASYKATRPGLQGVFNRLIRMRLRGKYSHSEIVFEPEDGVDHFMPDGSAARGKDGSLWCASSVAAEHLPAHSPRRAGKAGGVRFKRVVIDSNRWDMVRVDCDPVLAARWFRKHEGALYDWQLILGFVSWLIPQKSRRWTCSESTAAALGIDDGCAWRLDPCNLHVAVQAWAKGSR